MMDYGRRIGLELGAPTRNAFGEALRELGSENPNLIVLDGDVANSTRTEAFAQDFPERFFNLGIAESNLIGVASGLAASGKHVVAASFACFLLCNAYDQIRMGIAFPQANVTLVGSHAGISVGEDGPSQMAIEDISLATSLPHFVVVVPADATSTRVLTRAVLEVQGPAYLRTGRPNLPVVYDGNDSAQRLRLGEASRLRDGADVTIIACGLMVASALVAAHDLAQEGVEARVLDMHTIKPLDVAALEAAARETGAIVTAEEHLLHGGLGAAVARVVAERHPVPMSLVGLPDRYAESGRPDELLEKYGLMPADVAEAARRALARKRTTEGGTG
jgi:transketolase